jgi:hypothetical protein
MPTMLQGYDQVMFDRHAQTTMAQMLTEVEEAHQRNYALPAQLQSAGRYLYNQSGRGMIWSVRYKRHQVTANTGANRRNFAPRNLWKLAALGDRGYQATDSISSIEILQNKSKEALINVMSGFMERLKESVDDVLATQYYIDGNLAANVDFWQGLETMFGTNGTINASTGAQRASNNDDIVGYPYDTYATLSTELGAYGGSQESGTIWPNGNCDPQYEFWSPLVVNGSSTKFSATTHTWRYQALEALRYAITHTGRLGGKTARPTTVIMCREMYRQLKDLMGTKEEISVEDENRLRSLGFRDTVNFDGTEVTLEHSVPDGVAYGLNYENITVRSLYGQLLNAEGPQYFMEDQAHKAVVAVLGNLKFKSPRNFFKVVDGYARIA